MMLARSEEHGARDQNKKKGEEKKKRRKERGGKGKGKGERGTRKKKKNRSISGSAHVLLVGLSIVRLYIVRLGLLLVLCVLMFHSNGNNWDDPGVFESNPMFQLPTFKSEMSPHGPYANTSISIAMAALGEMKSRERGDSETDLTGLKASWLLLIVSQLPSTN